MIVNTGLALLDFNPESMVPVFKNPKDIYFKKAKSLQAGDVYAFSTKPVTYVHDGSLHVSNYKGHFNAKSVVFPKKIDNNLAWMLGLFHGDGCVTSKGIEISGNHSEWDVLARWAALSDKYFSITGRVTRDSHDGNGIRLRIHSVALSKWFSEIKKSNEPILVPDCIKYGSPSVRGAYLSGVLDADGRVRPDGVVELATTVYKEYAKDLASLSESIGVLPSCTFYSAQRRRDIGTKAKDHYTIKINGNTNRRNFVRMASLSSKLSGYDSPFGSPRDFGFPVDMFGTIPGYKKNQNILLDSAIKRGLIEASSHAPLTIKEIIK